MAKINNYDLEARTLRFSKEIISLCKSIKQSIVNKTIIIQLIRCATSIGANYREANGASPKKDFKNKISICKKEAKETKYWLLLLKESNPELINKIEINLGEIQELILIFSKIFATMNKN